MQKKVEFGSFEPVGANVIGTARSVASYHNAQVERIALVKFMLALANLVVIYLDKGVPVDESSRSLAVAMGVASLFAIYMALSWLAVKRDWIVYDRVRRFQPFLDVLMATGLVLATDGYLSPFNVWYAISIVSTGFSGSSLTPIWGAIVAILTQILVALIPQSTPLDGGVFTVRALFLLGFASLIAILSHQLVRQSDALRAIALFGQGIASDVDRVDAIHRYESFVKSILGADSVALRFDEGAADSESTVAISHGASTHILRKAALTADERELTRLLGERLVSAIRRIDMAQELIEAAARDERQRYADELHDTHLQTLAAVDMQVEVASRRTDRESMLADLRQIKSTVRKAAKHTRAFISRVHEYQPSGPTVVRDAIETRMPDCEIEMDDRAHLTEGQWRAVKMLAQEGINNARRHGEARSIRFSLRCDTDAVVASLTSDGKPPESKSKYGYGLRRLKTVVEANAGFLVLAGGSDFGSRLTATFPQESEA